MKYLGLVTLISQERQRNLTHMLELQANWLMGVWCVGVLLVCAAFPWQDVEV